MTDQHQRVAQAIWHTIGMRGGIPSVPQAELQTLVDAITAGIVAAIQAAPAPVGAPPVSPTTHDAPEQPVWQGDTKDISSVASGGRLASARYRLTTRMLYFEYGVVSTTSEQVPLWAIRDVDLRQSMTQKLRGVGNVVVHLEHSDYTGRPDVMLENVEQPQQVRDLINQHAQHARLEHQQRERTRYMNRG